MDNSASPLTLLYFGCDFSGWHNFWKIINTVATRCHILKLKCTKFDFDAGGVYNAPPDALVGFKGPTSEGKEMRGRRGEGEEGKGRERKERA